MRLVAGNTGYGIYKEWLPEDHLIDIKQIPELRRLTLSKVRLAQQSTNLPPPGQIGVMESTFLYRQDLSY